MLLESGSCCSRFLESRSLTKIYSYMMNMLPVLNLATNKTVLTMIENQKAGYALGIAVMPEQNLETFGNPRPSMENQLTQVRSSLYSRIFGIWVGPS